VPTLADASCVAIVDADGQPQTVKSFVVSHEHRSQALGEVSAAQLHPEILALMRQVAATRTKVRTVGPGLTFGEMLPALTDESSLQPADIRCLTAYPLVAFGTLVGVVTLATGASQREVTPAESALTEEFMDRGVIALENARLYHDVREADRRKDEFLAMLAHELRNPLAPIRNAAQILRLVGASDPAIISARDTIDRQVTHMVRLIDDLLDVSRLSRGKISLKVEVLDLGKLLASVCDDFRPLLEQNGLTLHVDIAPQPMLMEGDPARVAQILSNVLHNAGKFTNAGGKIDVGASIDPQRGVVSLLVRDTGIGMEPTMLAKAFEAFSQADRSLDRSRGGLGLGLALVKGLVELHQGSVRAMSEGFDKGTTMTMEFPLASATQLPAEDFEGETTVEAKHRILIVEDNRDAANMLQMLLALNGNEVVVAYDGEGALKVAQEFAPDVVLCDIGLPGEFNGYGVAESFRQHDRLSSAYLVAVTGYGRAEDRQKSLAAGFDAHLTKPISLKDLTKLLQNLAVKAN
jgi:signal transduction histidine kinase/CheY-like chemotaxis protein